MVEDVGLSRMRDFVAGSLERIYPHKEEVSGDVLLMIGRGSFSRVPGIGGAG